MDLKASKRGFKKEKTWIQMITFIVASLAVMVIHCCIWFEQKSCEGLLGGGFKVFWNIYISMIMQSSTVKFDI